MLLKAQNAICCTAGSALSAIEANIRLAWSLLRPLVGPTAQPIECSADSLPMMLCDERTNGVGCRQRVADAKTAGQIGHQGRGLHSAEIMRQGRRNDVVHDRRSTGL